MIDLGLGRNEIVDTIDLDLLRALRNAWREAPPPRFLIAAQVGYKPPEPKKKSNDLQDLLSVLQGVPGMAIDPRIFELPKGNA